MEQIEINENNKENDSLIKETLSYIQNFPTSNNNISLKYFDKLNSQFFYIKDKTLTSNKSVLFQVLNELFYNHEKSSEEPKLKLIIKTIASKYNFLNELMHTQYQKLSNEPFLAIKENVESKLLCLPSELKFDTNETTKKVCDYSLPYVDGVYSNLVIKNNSNSIKSINKDQPQLSIEEQANRLIESEFICLLKNNIEKLKDRLNQKEENDKKISDLILKEEELGELMESINPLNALQQQLNNNEYQLNSGENNELTNKNKTKQLLMDLKIAYKDIHIDNLRLLKDFGPAKWDIYLESVQNLINQLKDGESEINKKLTLLNKKRKYDQFLFKKKENELENRIQNCYQEISGLFKSNNEAKIEIRKYLKTKESLNKIKPINNKNQKITKI